MREIKFRGKSSQDETWAYGLLFEENCDGGSQTCIAVEPLSANGYGEIFPCCYEVVDPSTIGQFTGLLDKNDKEIYEDDIIYWEIDNGVGIESYVAIVRWSENIIERRWNNQYTYLVEYATDYCRGSYDYLCTPASYNASLEIIGNIYDNPELLIR